MSLLSIYSVKARDKVLGVKLTSEELDFIGQIAHGLGENLSSFTRKALTAYIQAL